MAVEDDFSRLDPIDEAELDAIEAAYALSKVITASSKQRRQSDGTNRCQSDRRRLPHWDLNSENRPNFPNHGGSSSKKRSPACVKMRYPVIKFGGQILYCSTTPQIEKATAELLDIIAAKNRNKEHISLGFDIEWRPAFIKGIPPILRTLLEDATSIKVGISIAGDAAKIFRDYGVAIRNLEDLSKLANSKLGGAPRMWGLGSLLEAVACKQLLKPKKLRLGNWEARVLSTEQLQYAATDAYVGWYLYQGLMSFPDLTYMENHNTLLSS